MLELRDLPTIIAHSAAAAQAECPDLTDLSPGSPFLALLNAGALNASYLQWLIVEVAKLARLATSEGEDVDSFVGDFNFARLPGVHATGTVTFSRYLTDKAEAIDVGTKVKTADGRVFEVVANAGHQHWSGSGYLLPIAEATITVPVRAVLAGRAMNVKANTITTISSPIAFDGVTNPNPFTNGVDEESDAAVKARFIHFINTRSQATIGAIEYAIRSTQQGLSWKVVENRNPAGGDQSGHFTVFVDDGSGQVSDGLLANLRAAIEAVRPIGVTYAVHRADVVTANVSVTVRAKAGYEKAELIGPVANAIADLIDGLGVGEPLSFYRLAHAAQDVVEGVESISSLFLNGATDDIGGLDRQVVRPGTVAVQ